MAVCLCLSTYYKKLNKYFLSVLFFVLFFLQHAVFVPVPNDWPKIITFLAFFLICFYLSESENRMKNSPRTYSPAKIRMCQQRHNLSNSSYTSTHLLYHLCDGFKTEH